jgi:hypothetical protein
VDRESLQDKLEITDKAIQREESGTGWTEWTPAELNKVLDAHVVDTALGCLEWECGLISCVMSARGIPFNLPKNLRMH